MKGIFHAEGEQQHVVAGNAEQTEPDHQHAGDGTAAKRDLHGGIETVVGCLGGAHIGADRDVHADITGETGEYRPDGKTDGGGNADIVANQYQQHDAGQTDSGVLTVEVGFGAFLHGGRDLPHSLIASGLGQYPFYRYRSINQRNAGTEQGKP